MIARCEVIGGPIKDAEISSVTLSHCHVHVVRIPGPANVKSETHLKSSLSQEVRITSWPPIVREVRRFVNP